MNIMFSMKTERTESTDLLARYFLRRLAISRGKLKLSSPDARYRDALVEVIFVCVVMPALGLINFLGVASMTWWNPIVTARWPWLSVRLVFLIVAVLALLLGHFWLGNRFERYKVNPIGCKEFDSEKDRSTVFWQKFAVIVICGLVAPWLGYAVNYLIR